jgi:hypothetical protein
VEYQIKIIKQKRKTLHTGRQFYSSRSCAQHQLRHITWWGDRPNSITSTHKNKTGTHRDSPGCLEHTESNNNDDWADGKGFFILFPSRKI